MKGPKIPINTVSFPATNNISEVEQMPNAELTVINSNYGHFVGSISPALSAQVDVLFIDTAIKKLLKKIG